MGMTALDGARTTEQNDGEHPAEAWLRRCRSYPCHLHPILETSDDGRCKAGLLVVPGPDVDELNVRRDAFTLFGGTLSGDNATKLNATLKNIGFVHGVSMDEALAVMGMAIIFLLSIRDLQTGQTPLVPVPISRGVIEEKDRNRYLLKLNLPRLTIEQALDTWLTHCAGMNLLGLWKPPEGAGFGRFVYCTFPPGWVPKEKYDELPEHDRRHFQLPLHVDVDSFGAVNGFSELLKHQQRIGLPLQIQIGSPG